MNKKERRITSVDKWLEHKSVHGEGDKNLGSAVRGGSTEVGNSRSLQSPSAILKNLD
jgi:hypothetical protein